ncbi:MAG TPA: hypothetical protein DDX92_12725 [Flavobacteriales bacterium]|jgi:YD repeat-containing protein|nr:hypothetical protein [Flavobacteriales bacterium]
MGYLYNFPMNIPEHFIGVWTNRYIPKLNALQKQTQRLENVRYKTGKALHEIDFIYTFDRYDFGNLPRLSQIKHNVFKSGSWNTNPITVEEVSFTHDRLSNRLYLKEIERSGTVLFGPNSSNSDHQNKYEFSYYNPSLIKKAGHSHYPVDYWGYYNGIDNSGKKRYPNIFFAHYPVGMKASTTLIHAGHPNLGYIPEGSNMMPGNLINIRSGLMKWLKTPSGLEYDFEYEKHEVLNPQYWLGPGANLIEVEAGGTRLKEIRASEKGAIKWAKELNYEDDQGNSTGLLMDYPEHFYLSLHSKGECTGAWVGDDLVLFESSVLSSVPRSGIKPYAKGSYVGYDRVSVKTKSRIYEPSTSTFNLTDSKVDVYSFRNNTPSRVTPIWQPYHWTAPQSVSMKQSHFEPKQMLAINGNGLIQSVESYDLTGSTPRLTNKKILDYEEDEVQDNWEGSYLWNYLPVRKDAGIINAWKLYFDAILPCNVVPMIPLSQRFVYLVKVHEREIKYDLNGNTLETDQSIATGPSIMSSIGSNVYWQSKNLPTLESTFNSKDELIEKRTYYTTSINIVDYWKFIDDHIILPSAFIQLIDNIVVGGEAFIYDSKGFLTEKYIYEEDEENTINAVVDLHKNVDEWTGFQKLFSYQYQADGRLSRVTDRADISTSFVYGTLDKPIALITNANTNQFAYTSFENDLASKWRISYAANTPTSSVTPKTGLKAGNLKYGNIVLNNITTDHNSDGEILLEFFTKSTRPVHISGVQFPSYDVDPAPDDEGWYYHRVRCWSGNITLVNPTYGSDYFIDEIRAYPYDSQVVTYNYDEYREQLTSIVDGRAHVTSFDYDGLGNRVGTYDDSRELIELVEYHYHGQ